MRIGSGLVGLNWSYFLFMIPCLILSIICSAKVKSNFNKYSKVYNSRRMTGAQAAQQVLNAHGVTGVRIESVKGNLTDHFDLVSFTVLLDVFMFTCLLPGIADKFHCITS